MPDEKALYSNPLCPVAASAASPAIEAPSRTLFNSEPAVCVLRRALPERPDGDDSRG